MADDAEMDEEIERQLEAEARNNINNDRALKMETDVIHLVYIYINEYAIIRLIYKQNF